MKPMPTFAIGQAASVARTYTAADLAEFAALADTAAAAAGTTARRAIPGPLLGGLFSYLLGTVLPGRGTNYLKQSLLYPAPAYVNEALTATVEIIRLRPEKDLVNLRTTCTAAGGRIVCTGEALVRVRDVQGQAAEEAGHAPH